jgi:hypothetical protein
MAGPTCPARPVAVVGQVKPAAKAETMSPHLTAVGRKVAAGNHAALSLDGAGYNIAAAFAIPKNVTRVCLSPYAPGLDPMLGVSARQLTGDRRLRQLRRR